MPGKKVCIVDLKHYSDLTGGPVFYLATLYLLNIHFLFDQKRKYHQVRNFQLQTTRKPVKKRGFIGSLSRKALIIWTSDMTGSSSLTMLTKYVFFSSSPVCFWNACFILNKIPSLLKNAGHQLASGTNTLSFTTNTKKEPIFQCLSQKCWETAPPYSPKHLF